MEPRINSQILLTVIVDSIVAEITIRPSSQHFSPGEAMKRDMDLVRKILLAVEQEDSGYAGSNPAIEGYSQEQVDYHIYLMWQAGLVDAVDPSEISTSSPAAILNNITWKGHDFLDVAKSSSVWEKAKEKAKTVGGSLTFELLKELLVATARDQLALK